MKVRFLAVLAVLVLVMGMLFTATSSGERRHDPQIIKTLGSVSFEANALIQSTFRFSPDRLFPHRGDKVTVSDRDRGDEPHTLSIVRRGQLPTSGQEVFECAACNAALDAHFAQGDQPILKVNVGAPGLDQPGDSLWLTPGASISSNVSAPSGTTLYYLCAIHGWMQGRLTVG